MDYWFEKEDIDAAEFVDNCQEILTKLRAIEQLRRGVFTLDTFWKEIQT